MLSIPDCINNLDANGRPAGGSVQGVGLTIHWQNGPLSLGGTRLSPNGAFVETIIEAVLQRIEFYQGSPFACDENARAIGYLEGALLALRQRTARRTEQGIEGTWTPDTEVAK